MGERQDRCERRAAACEPPEVLFVFAGGRSVLLSAHLAARFNKRFKRNEFAGRSGDTQSFACGEASSGSQAS